MNPAKLTEEQKAEIRRLYSSTEHLPAVQPVVQSNPERWSLRKLGERYCVSRETIRRILAGEDIEGEASE